MVYFIQMGDDGPIKIGYTGVSVKKRRSQLASLSPSPLYVRGVLIRGDMMKERELHAKFKHLRIRPRGEWFRPGVDLLAFIAEKARDPDAERRAWMDESFAAVRARRPEQQPKPEFVIPEPSPKPIPALRECARCSTPFGSIEGDKYCGTCANAVLTELTDAGYFKDAPRRRFIKRDSLYRTCG